MGRLSRRWVLRADVLAFSCLLVRPSEAQLNGRLTEPGHGRRSSLLTDGGSLGQCLLQSLATALFLLHGHDPTAHAAVSTAPSPPTWATVHEKVWKDVLPSICVGRTLFPSGPGGSPAFRWGEPPYIYVHIHIYPYMYMHIYIWKHSTNAVRSGQFHGKMEDFRETSPLRPMFGLFPRPGAREKRRSHLRTPRWRSSRRTRSSIGVWGANYVPFLSVFPTHARAGTRRLPAEALAHPPVVRPAPPLFPRRRPPRKISRGGPTSVLQSSDRRGRNSDSVTVPPCHHLCEPPFFLPRRVSEAQQAARAGRCGPGRCPLRRRSPSSH